MEALVLALDGAAVHMICRRTNSTQQAVYCEPNIMQMVSQALQLCRCKVDPTRSNPASMTT